MASRVEKRIEHWKSEKANRHLKKQIKPNRKSKRPRSKEWTAVEWKDADEWESEIFPSTERMMPLGGHKKWEDAPAGRSVVLDEAERLPEDEKKKDIIAGVVSSVSPGHCQVELEGRELLCSLRGSLSAEDSAYTNVVAVGDNVLVSENVRGGGVVEHILPRKSALVRPDVFNAHLKQVIVANADQLLVVVAWRSPKIWFELIDRMIIAAECYNLRPIICVNKIDLAEDLSEPEQALEPYRELGYQVLFTNGLTGGGIDRLKEALHGRMTVLAGLSGVGKSTLLDRVQPGLGIRIGEINETKNEGRHTTSQAKLVRVDGSATLVDTPGIREFGLANLHRSELANFYPEFASYAARCRFKDCSHIKEPGCAVQDAVSKGLLPLYRYESYVKIFSDLD